MRKSIARSEFVVARTAPFFTRRTRQVLSNLLDNAIKYTPEESPIDILTSATSTHVRVSVQDHGAGIPKAQREILFTPFYRGNSDETIRAYFVDEKSDPNISGDVVDANIPMRFISVKSLH